jgi:enoyl-CoA hydratase/carnithine racemase
VTISTRFQGSAAIVVLNRPHRYNATDLKTIQQITQFLSDCSTNNYVEKIIITSNHPKAFCAGGDIRAAYDAMQTNNMGFGLKFFDAEYKLIYDMATYSKPIISLVNGLCLGGGMGLSMHNQFRVITENAVLGMPETIIGFFPDIGASFRFAEFPRPWANFYGLTGHNIPIAHALKWGIADYFVPSPLLPDLLDALCMSTDIPDQVIKQFSQHAPDVSIFGNEWVDDIFAKSLNNIFVDLETHPHPETKIILNDLNARSPLSLYITHKLFEMSAFLDLKKSLQLDQVIAMNFLKDSDFEEGIRAQVIDKDRKPKWKYTFSNINNDMVRCFFTPTYSDCKLAIVEA